jgi:glycosyltransferase involved in cell wall biosynthesis
VRTSANPALAALCESYAKRLIEAGWTDARRRREIGRPMPDGAVFDERLSLLLAQATADGERFDPFDPEQHEAFMRWLGGPAAHGAGAGVNRFLYRIYCEREDLQRAYPDLDGGDGEGFAGWAWVFGRPEMGIPERFLPPRQAALAAAPPPEEKTAARTPLPHGPRPELSMTVTGLLTGTLGLGEAARGYVRALQAAGIEVSTESVDVRQFVQIGAVPHEGYARVDYDHLRRDGAAGFNLICINADELPSFADSMPEEFFERPSIGVWAWETDHVPDRWSRSFGLLDEIWVYSNYVAENLARVAPIPVTRIPPPVSPPAPGDVELDLGVPEGFRFLFMFDFFSTIARKNPVGLIDAFRRAFAPGEGPQLVVKTINGVHRSEALDAVLWAARGRPDVHVVDRSLSAPERDALVAGCDCYVSLHRSEGFGLTLAECMALGKPVIGTAFSAPTDFMTEENSYPVPYEITRVGPDAEIYPAQGTWADPDLDEAARLMRRVMEQPGEAAAKGAVARRDIERLYSPAAVGEMIRARLEEIRGLWG